MGACSGASRNHDYHDAGSKWKVAGYWLAAQSADKYHMKLKHHECTRPHGIADPFIHVGGLSEVVQRCKTPCGCCG